MGARDSAKVSQGDRVVTPEQHRRDACGEDGGESFLDLLVGVLDITGHDREVPMVDAGEGSEHIDAETGVVGPQQDRGVADRAGPEAGPHAEADPRVERRPDVGQVDVREVPHIGQASEGTYPGEARGLQGIDRSIARHRITSPYSASIASALGVPPLTVVRSCGQAETTM